MRAALDEPREHTQLRAGLARAYQDAAVQPMAQRLAEQLALAELAGYLSIVAGYPVEVRPKLLNASRIWRTPGIFKRAVQWFRDKVDAATSVPVQYEIAERAAKRAAPLAAAAHLDTAARLIKHAESRAEQGAHVDEVKTELRRALDDLGLKPKAAPLVESVPLREELQAAFSVARREVLSLDFYRAAYPFWRYNSVLDTRTTEGCRALNGLVLPAKDPRWVGFTPPRHWNCRAHIEAIVHSEGVNAPKRQPIEKYAGEGTFATLKEEWEPRPGNYPPDLFDIYAEARDIADPHIEVTGPWWRKDFKQE